MRKGLAVKIRAAVLLASGAASLVAVGCADPAPATTRPTTVRIGVAAPGSLGEVQRVLTSEPLLRVGREGRHQPWLAERWSVDPTGGVLSLVLKPGVSFHDGVVLDAAVVKTLLDGFRAEPRSLRDYPTLGDIASVEVVDDRQVDIRYNGPVGLHLDDLTVFLERRVDGRAVGTGPFRIDRQSADRVVLVAHPPYHRGRPTVDVVEMTIYPTLRAAWAAMMRGEHDFLFEVPIAARDFVEAESRVALFRSDRPYALMIGFNTDHPVLRDPRVRRALNLAIDRRVVIDRAMRGEGSPSSGLWPSHWVYQGSDPVYRYNPALADRLLTAAGYPATVTSSPGPHRPPSRLRFTCLVFDNRGEDQLLATVVQRQLYDIGVDMEIVTLDPGGVRDRLIRGDYDAALVPQNTGRVLSRLFTFWHSTQPQALFPYTAADAPLEALRDAATPEELVTAAQRLQQVFYDDPPAIFIVNPTQARAVDRRYRVPAEPGRDIVERIWQWSQEEPRLGRAQALSTFSSTATYTGTLARTSSVIFQPVPETIARISRGEAKR